MNTSRQRGTTFLTCPGHAVRALFVLGAWSVLSGSASAHRLDEYLQATRVAIERDRVDVDIDLTPGVAVANQVIAWIDADRDGRISPAEGNSYAGLVVAALVLDVDDRRQPLTLVERRFPSLDEMRLGIGTIRLTATARVPLVSAGRHRIFYRNDHRPELSVYLVNALAPTSAGVEIAGQQRDWEQHELRFDYRVSWTLLPSLSSRPFVAGLGMASFLAALTWRHRRRVVTGRPGPAASV